MRTYLTAFEVLAMHHDLIERFGGSKEVRDIGLLQAALARPQTGYYSSLIEEAAALWESLSQNHPFVDGNKRTVFAAMHVFLKLNGYELATSPNEAIESISALYEAGSFRYEYLVEWLTRNAVKH